MREKNTPRVYNMDMAPKPVLSILLALLFLLHPITGNAAERAVKPIKIGIASMITPVDTVKYYQDIVDYISSKLGVPVEMVQRKTYSEMDRLLELGEVDIAFLCSSPYVKNKREFGVELLVAPEVNGRPFYRSYIIAHSARGIDSLDDLKGRSFAFTDPRSNTGKLYPEYALAKMGLTHGIPKIYTLMKIADALDAKLVIRLESDRKRKHS